MNHLKTTSRVFYRAESLAVSGVVSNLWLVAAATNVSDSVELMPLSLVKEGGPFYMLRSALLK